MKIQVLSDLHIEHIVQPIIGKDWQLIDLNICPDPDIDVLVLAGDITTLHQLFLLSTLLKEYGKPVIYIPGNHEYYGSGMTLEATREKYRAEFKGSNVHFLDQGGRVQIGNTMFLGGTLWTDLNNDYDLVKFNRFQDAQMIKGLDRDTWLEEHGDTCISIEAEMANRAMGKYNYSNLVVVTHHLPSPRSTPLRFKNSPINMFFNTDLEYLMDQDVSPNLWIHGHTHDSMDYTVHDTRVVCNPFGYKGYETNPLFSPVIIELDDTNNSFKTKESL